MGNQYDFGAEGLSVEEFCRRLKECPQQDAPVTAELLNKLFPEYITVERVLASDVREGYEIYTLGGWFPVEAVQNEGDEVAFDIGLKDMVATFKPDEYVDVKKSRRPTSE